MAKGSIRTVVADRVEAANRLGTAVAERVESANRLAAEKLPPAEGALGEGPVTSPLHDERVAAILGIALAVAFTVCFLTGLYSHFEQHPPLSKIIPAAPAGLYRITQGVHVATGIASIPLLLAKLWTVWPRFFVWPPAKSIVHGIERFSLLPLVGGALFQLVTGVSNIAHWYWFHFFFTTIHYDVAWVTMGALVVHVAARWATSRRALARTHPGLGPEAPTSGATSHGLMTRRGFFWTVGAGSVTLTAATIGETVRPLVATDLIGVRRAGVGPQGVPVNRSAEDAGVTHLPAQIATYRLVVGGPHLSQQLSLSLADLQAMPQIAAVLPISCVEGWSTSAHWEGIRLDDLVKMVGGRPGASVTVESLERNGAYRTSYLDPAQTGHGDTLLALKLNGEALNIEHGFPLRLIAPNRPGVLQTKWVGQLVIA